MFLIENLYLTRFCKDETDVKVLLEDPIKALDYENDENTQVGEIKNNISDVIEKLVIIQNDVQQEKTTKLKKLCNARGTITHLF